MVSQENKFLLFRKYLTFSIGTWVSAVISFLFSPIVSWYISPGEYGKWSMFWTVQGFLLTVVSLGLQNSLMRFYFEKSENERQKLIFTAFMPTLVAWAVLSLLVVFFRTKINIFILGEGSVPVYLWLIFSLLLGNIFSFVQTILRINNKGIKYSFLQVTSVAFNLGFSVLFLTISYRDFRALLYGGILGSFFATTLGIVMVSKAKILPHFDKQLFLELLHYGFPFIFASLLWWLLNWTDRLVLRFYTNFFEIGLYSAAFKLVQGMGIFTTGFSTLWYPFAYEQYEKNPNNKKVFSKVFDYVSFSMISMGLLFMLSKDIVFILFSKTYRQAAAITPFLLLLPIMSTACVVVGRGIDFMKKTYWGIVIDGITFAFNLIGNLLLIPILGAKGAALSTGLSFILFFFLESTVSMKLYPVDYKLKSFYAATSIFVFASAINSFSVNKLINSVLTFVALLVVIYIYFGIFSEVLNIARDYLARKFGKFRKD